MQNNFKSRLLRLYPEFTNVLGPYKRKDGRRHVILNNSSLSKKNPKKLKTISYSKAKLEVKLKRKLADGETADHIDENKFNDKTNNLQVLSSIENKKKNERHRFGKFRIIHCPTCNIKMKYRKRKSRNNKRKFCSNSCRSKFYGNQYSKR